jgi:ABC-type uncharacterized transport system permease subunit
VSLIGAALLLVVVAALSGLLLVLAVAVGLAVLNLVYLPRAATRLRIPVGWLALVLIPFLVLVGFLVGGVEGAAWGVGMWLVAIGLPRAIGRDLLRRGQRRVEASLGYYVVPPRPDTTGAKTPTRDPVGRPLPPADDRARGESGL